MTFIRIINDRRERSGKRVIGDDSKDSFSDDSRIKETYDKNLSGVHNSADTDSERVMRHF